MQSPHARSRQWRVLALTTVAGAALAGTIAGAGSATASSHREAPLVAGDPKVDNTDVYAFVSPDQANTVTIIANWLPFEEPNGGPNFFPWQAGAHYDINVDNDGDAKADLTYRWTFADDDRRGTDTFLYANGPVTSLTDENLLFRQTWTLTRIEGDDETEIATGVAAPSRVGNATMPAYRKLRAQAIKKLAGGGKAFAGQADDPFFLDLRVFDLLYGANLKASGHDTLQGYNVNTIALQLPKAALALNGDAGRNPVIGIWSSTSKQTMQLSPGKAEPTGEYVQVSRLGNPLVNEVVVPAGLKDAFNSITPDVDATVEPVVQRVLDPELPKLIEGIYGIKAPKTPRNDLVEIFLTGIAKDAPTLDGSKAPIQADLNSQILNQDADADAFRPSEMLRLNTAVPVSKHPSRLGVLAGDLQGFPNGRRLTDDVIDIAIQAVEGAAQTGKLVPALAAGDGVNANDNRFGTVFPYVALPNTAAVNASKNRNAEAMPIGGVDAGNRPTWLPLPVAQAGTIAVVVMVLGTGLVVTRRRRRLDALPA